MCDSWNNAPRAMAESTLPPDLAPLGMMKNRIRLSSGEDAGDLEGPQIRRIDSSSPKMLLSLISFLTGMSTMKNSSVLTSSSLLSSEIRVGTVAGIIEVPISMIATVLIQNKGSSDLELKTSSTGESMKLTA